MNLELENDSIDNSDATQPSSEAPESTNQPAAPAAETKPEPTPFHEHPRFKELVEQKNSALAASKALEARLAQMESRLSQPAQPSTPSKTESEFESLINDLKQVDPRLAAQLQAHAEAAKRVEAITARLDGFEKTTAQEKQEAVRTSAVAKVNQLHESNKVSPEVKNFINDRLDLLYMQGKLNPQNLEAEYKTAFDSMSKYIDAIKRSERESYVSEKKKDAGVPTSQPKGKQATPPAKAPTKYKDRESMLGDIQKDVLKQLKADREAASA